MARRTGARILGIFALACVGASMASFVCVIPTQNLFFAGLGVIVLVAARVIGILNAIVSAIARGFTGARAPAASATRTQTPSRAGATTAGAEAPAMTGDVGSAFHRDVFAFSHGRVERFRIGSRDGMGQPGEGRWRSTMLADARVATRLPVKDLERARRFYREKLGLEPLEERPGGLRYRCGGADFALFESAGAASGSHTQMGWEVADIEITVAALRAQGVVFEEYDLPGLQTVNGIAEIEGNYPSKGVGERGAWFRDSEGNLLGLGQPVRR